MVTTTADDPLSLHSISRSFVADSITPISAYLALAQPGRSCLLESVEGTERISRFSFIGLDYLESFTVDRDPAMLERIRGAMRRYTLDRADLPFPGGAVCAFTYDAARALEPAIRDEAAMPPADVRFSGTLEAKNLIARKTDDGFMTINRLSYAAPGEPPVTLTLCFDVSLGVATR